MKLFSKILIVLFIIFYSCDTKTEINFNSQKWLIEKDLEHHPYRDLMIQDIIENKLFTGFEYNRLIDSLGIPDNVKPRKNNEIYYLIKNDYGWDIDPVYTKYLIFTLSSDSIVKSVNIYEWKK